MIAKVGDVVESDFGRGKIVAITKEWVIHEDDDGTHEFAVSREDGWICFPVDEYELGGGEKEANL